MALPGRDGRSMQLRPDLCAFAASLADDLASALDRPFVMLGHSLGAWLAFEIARELRRRRWRSPELLVVAAIRAPHGRATAPPTHRLSDEDFLTEIQRRFDGIPPGVRDSPEMLQLLLPALRADMQMAESYEYADEPPIDVEILALGGAADRAVSSAQLAEWQCHTTRDFWLRVVPGGHFFLFDSCRDQTGSKSSHAARLTPAMRMIISRIERCLPESTLPSELPD
jgi:medium-chain acyl-[acyl-carrier-protein] hydrolase